MEKHALHIGSLKYVWITVFQYCFSSSVLSASQRQITYLQIILLFDCALWLHPRNVQRCPAQDWLMGEDSLPYFQRLAHGHARQSQDTAPLCFGAGPSALTLWYLFSSDPELLSQSVLFSVSPKVFFYNTVLRLVVSTWFNEQGWITLKLKSCHCFI